MKAIQYRAYGGLADCSRIESSMTEWEVSLQRIGVVTFPGFHVMSFAALSVFEVANSEFGERRYDVHFISETGGPLRTSAGLMVETEPFDDSVFDTLIIGGSTESSFTRSEAEGSRDIP